MQNLTDDQLLQELEKRFKQNKRSLFELQKLTSELSVLNRKLEESESLKTHFISNITNEIVNPFAAILGLSRSILDVKKENWDKVISMVHLIHSEAFALDFQLKNIFAAAKLEAGELAPEIMNVNIDQLIRNTIDNFGYEVQKKQIEVDYQFDFSPGSQKGFYFPTDAEKLKLIVSNLLSNAVKFSHSGGKVEIIAGLDKQNLLIRIADYGVGVSEENKRVIYDRFTRLDSGINSLNRGHGLGLSVNKALIDLLEGEIALESEPGKYTVFTVCIPEGKSLPSMEGFASDGNEFLFDDNNQDVF